MAETVIVVTKSVLGTTCNQDTDFGMEMLDKFFHALEKPSARPKAICFYTEGVQILKQGSPLELSLKLLESLGVQLIACESCVKHYGLDGQLAVGLVGGMGQIVDLLSTADKVITV